MRKAVVIFQSKSKRGFKSTAVLLWTLLSLGLVNPAWGLGMGEVSFQSALGEPLQAKIDLLLEDSNAYSLENIRVRQIGPAEAGKMGFDLAESYYGIRFKPVQEGKQFVIELTTNQPVNEPYLNILVEVRWPQGTAYREYTMLLDPPMAPVVKAASSGQSVPSPLQTSSRQAQPVPAAGSARGPAAGDYAVVSGDSLYSIARRTESRGDESVALMMDWIFDNNPQAFIAGDRNRLMAGATLTLPSRAQVMAASSAVAKADRPVQTALAKPEPVKTAGPQLSLDEGQVLTPRQLAAIPVDEIPAEVIRAHITAARESNDKLERENDALRNHMAMLEASDYVGNLEKLIALKDQQIAALVMQQDLQAAADARPVKAPVENVAPVEEVPTVEVVPTVDRPSLIPVNTETAFFDAGNKGWWAFYTLVMLLLLAFLAYYLRNRSTKHEYNGLGPVELAPNEEQAMLEELDELANQYHAANGENPEPETAPDYVGKAVGGQNSSRSVPGQQRRPDDVVMRDIEKRIQDYQPAQSSRAVLQVPESHDEIDGIISEALAHITEGKFDLAEAILLEADFETRGKEGRLGDAIEYLNYCRNAKGNRSAS